MNRRYPWLRMSLNAWSLGVEASSVIALRMMKIAAGGKGGDAEATRMISEKINAGLDLQRMAMTGDLSLSPRGAAKALGYYRRKIRANRRRLMKTAT